MSKTYVTQIKIIAQAPPNLAWPLRRFVADPDPSPVCERRGHAWGEAKHNGIPDSGTTIQMCTRCAKRGAYVFLTTHSDKALAAAKKRQAESDRREAEQIRRRLAQIEARLAETTVSREPQA